ncbi:DHA2 family efflux MFS transporter permease subunit [Paenibacillus sp. TRM 82003]|nr:DHA2 family efflux MFS transporter permease subunit [Paenibacillus sp. TRM 82003]
MEHLDHKKKITIMIAILAAMLFAALNQTIVSTALPRIISELNSSMDYYSWIFTVYMLASTITAVLVGKLSDTYGRKPFILIGIFVFIVGSLLCGFSQNIIQLIIYRGIQGLGAGMIMSTAFTAIGDLFAPRERGRWQGLMGGVFGLASVFGPTLGGWIVDNADWHWVFWVFLPIGIVAFALIIALFPSVPKREGEPVDFLGSIFLTTCIVPLLLAFSWAGNNYAWSSPQIVGLLVGAGLSLGLFLLAEWKAKAPVLPLGMFRNSVFTVSNIVGFIIGAGMFGAIMYMPFFVQGVIGTSATISGYVMMPMTLSLVAGSAISGQIITKTGKYKVQALLGLLIMGVGMGLLTTMNTSTTNLTAILYMIVVGLGLGTSFPIFTLTVQNAVSDRLLGVATASTQLFRQLGGTIGVAIMGTVMSHRMGERMAEVSGTVGGGEGGTSIPAEVQASLEKLKDPQVLIDPDKLTAVQEAIPADLQSIFANIVEMLRGALSYALTGVFLTCAIVIGVAFLLTFFLKEVPLRSAAAKRNNEGKTEEGRYKLQENNG